jgi:hypothetical protein
MDANKHDSTAMNQDATIEELLERWSMPRSDKQDEVKT